MIDGVLRLIGEAQGALFERMVEPALYQLGLMDWADDVFEGVGFALFGGLEIAFAYLLLRPLEWWRPVEKRPGRRPGHREARRAVRTDVVYTLVHRIGVVPALRDWPFVTLLAYIVLLDLGEYWRHRLQHRLGWWWALHSLHHDQRQMTLWSDDRNHLLDDVLAAAWSGTLALLIGVAPEEYPLVLVLFRLIESLAHTNVRLGFGRLGTPLVVGPQYHRLHHAIEHARPPFEGARGCNFAVILPLWDVLFGTWRREPNFPPTGVASLAGSAISCGYLRHQFEGLRRLGAELAHLAYRGRPGFVAAFRRAAPQLSSTDGVKM